MFLFSVSHYRELLKKNIVDVDLSFILKIFGELLCAFNMTPNDCMLEFRMNLKLRKK